MQNEADSQGRSAEGAAGKEEEGTRLQQAGEGGTTRFGMEDGDNTDLAATGGPRPESEASERSE